ncbi:MAG: hypothetical protein K0S08_966 [Gammaproteobacteria bacterium]|jgi:2-methylisocitrate lyase-like PEP mutase family enzyme|nr:hypothetical protein [Gammaproteobacteria bacterium]
MALHSLSVFRALRAAALMVYQAICAQGTQQEVVPMMQTREKLNQLFNENGRK